MECLIVGGPVGSKGRVQCKGIDLPEIPKGAFWARWKDLSGRDCYAMSSVKVDFPPQKLPEWNLRSLI